MACNLINVKSSASCKEDFSGVGSRFYVFSGEGIAEVDLSGVESMQDYITALEAYMANGVVQVDIKPKSGKVTSSSNANGGGFSNVFTGVVANNMTAMSELSRVLNNTTDWGILVPAGNNEFYVLYDKAFGIEFGDEGDTGDTPDSDHGHTLTITCSPMLYGLAKGHLSSMPTLQDTIDMAPKS